MKISREWTDEERMLAVKRIIDRWMAKETPRPAFIYERETEAEARKREAWDHITMLVALSTDELEASRTSIEEMVGSDE